MGTGRQHRTQKGFIDAARETGGVAYDYPGRFRCAGYEIAVPLNSVGRFLGRLSGTMNFADYDRLSRAVWVAHLQNHRSPS